MTAAMQIILLLGTYYSSVKENSEAAWRNCRTESPGKRAGEGHEEAEIDVRLLLLKWVSMFRS